MLAIIVVSYINYPTVLSVTSIDLSVTEKKWYLWTFNCRCNFNIETSCTHITTPCTCPQVNIVFLVLVLHSIYINKTGQDTRKNKPQCRHALAMWVLLENIQTVLIIFVLTFEDTLWRHLWFYYLFSDWHGYLDCLLSMRIQSYLPGSSPSSTPYRYA